MSRDFMKLNSGRMQKWYSKYDAPKSEMKSEPTKIRWQHLNMSTERYDGSPIDETEHPMPPIMFRSCAEWLHFRQFIENGRCCMTKHDPKPRARKIKRQRIRRRPRNKLWLYSEAYATLCSLSLISSHYYSIMQLRCPQMPTWCSKLNITTLVGLIPKWYRLSTDFLLRTLASLLRMFSLVYAILHVTYLHVPSL